MKYKLILITALASVGFFNPHQLLSEQMQKLVFYLCIMAGLAMALADGVSLHGVKYPRTPYALLLIFMPVAAVMGTAFHMQSLPTSLIVILPTFLAYLFFFILMKLDVDWHRIMKMYLWLFAAATFVYFANLATFPSNFFGKPIQEDLSRGILRLPVVFSEMFTIGVFYAINCWFETKNKKWLWITVWLFFMVILTVIRQQIALTGLLGVLFLLKNVNWKIKISICAAMAAVVFVVLPMIPMYQAMVELTEMQKEKNENAENIRITSWRYYTYENQTNSVTAVLGNGQPSAGNSRWGTQFDSEIEENGCLYVDVGWAGFYWLFGTVCVGSLLVIMIKTIVKKKSSDRQFINYSMLYILITSVASAPIFYYNQIISICVLLYFTYGKSCNDTETAPIEAEARTGATRNWWNPNFRQLCD